MVGTWLKVPDEIALATWSFSSTPSTFGVHGSMTLGPPTRALISVVTDNARRQASTVPGSPQPICWAKRAPVACADAGVWVRSEHGPLSVIARSNRPEESGEARLLHTLWPPADSPKIVTLPASPPKAAMLRRTQ